MFGIEQLIPNVGDPSTTAEILFSLGGFLMNILVLPSLLDKTAAIPRTQSVFSSIVLLFCFSVPYYWIGFYIPAIMNFIGFVMWSLVAIYRSPRRTHSDSGSVSQSVSFSD